MGKRLDNRRLFEADIFGSSVLETLLNAAGSKDLAQRLQLYLLRNVVKHEGKH
jgi:hypothetical protein